jgi:hypothetical protein
MKFTEAKLEDSFIELLKQQGFPHHSGETLPRSSIEAKMLLVALKRYTKNNSPINTFAARQRIADVMIGANTYTF